MALKLATSVRKNCFSNFADAPEGGRQIRGQKKITAYESKKTVSTMIFNN